MPVLQNRAFHYEGYTDELFSFNYFVLFFFVVSCKSNNIRRLELIAESGDHEAQGNLGFMYQYGYGVKGNIKEAIKWYKLAASDGDPVAEGTVGRLYFEMDDYQNALPWFKKCALHGNSDCQGMVGTMYLYSQGVSKNMGEAKRWLKKSADQGNGSAQCYMGDIYFNEKSYEQAFPYLQKAFEKSCATAAKHLSKMYQDGLFVKENAVQAKKMSEKYADFKAQDDASED